MQKKTRQLGGFCGVGGRALQTLRSEEASRWSVHCQNVDSENVNSHNVEVKMSECQNVDNGNGESQNGEHYAQYVVTVATPVKKKKLSYLYVYFNIVSNPAQKVANLSVRIVVNEVSDSCI